MSKRCLLVQIIMMSAVSQNKNGIHIIKVVHIETGMEIENLL